jgi:hypothetical protein
LLPSQHQHHRDATHLAEETGKLHAQLDEVDTLSPQPPSALSPAVLERVQRFPICLLLPNADVPYLSMWEAALFRGLPVVRVCIYISNGCSGVRV